MSVIATAVKHLLAAGVTGDALVAAIAEMEACAPAIAIDASATRRREKDAAYQAARRAGRKAETGSSPRRQTSAESADSNDAPPPNDIYSNPPPEPSSAKADALPADEVVEAWNEMAKANGLQQARKLNPGRRKHLAARIREHSRAAVFEAITKLGDSDWHTGRDPKNSGWQADLGWLLKSGENFQKIIERTGTPERPSRRPVDTKGYGASLAAKPWMRGRENELELGPATGPPA